MSQLMRLQPRGHHFHTSRRRAVLVTDRNGFVRPGTDQGLFVRETRLLSCYRYLIDGTEPLPAGLSNVEQHSWFGYYLALPSSTRLGALDEGSGMIPPVLQNTLELAVQRWVGNALHEKLRFRNFTGQRVRFMFEIDLRADFAGITETGKSRTSGGKKSRDG